MKLNLWSLKLKLHIIFMCHKALLFFEFYVQPFKTVVTILRSLGTQKGPGWPWPVSRGFSNPTCEDGIFVEDSIR